MLIYKSEYTDRKTKAWMERGVRSSAESYRGTGYDGQSMKCVSVMRWVRGHIYSDSSSFRATAFLRFAARRWVSTMYSTGEGSCTTHFVGFASSSRPLSGPARPSRTPGLPHPGVGSPRGSAITKHQQRTTRLDQFEGHTCSNSLSSPSGLFADLFWRACRTKQ